MNSEYEDLVLQALAEILKDEEAAEYINNQVNGRIIDDIPTVELYDIILGAIRIARANN
jgi:hypothetical protein